MRKKVFRVLYVVADSDISCLILTILLTVISIIVVAKKSPFCISSPLLAILFTVVVMIACFLVVKVAMLKLFDIIPIYWGETTTDRA